MIIMNIEISNRREIVLDVIWLVLSMLSLNEVNKWADFWHFHIGLNVIPADTENKTTYENWLQWQDKSISDELHEERKKNCEYNKGIALIPGKIWRGPFKGKYLVAIDLDNKKSIEEFCRGWFRRIKTKNTCRTNIKS